MLDRFCQSIVVMCVVSWQTHKRRLLKQGLEKVSQFVPHHISSPIQGRVRFRKQPKRKRRLAYARSGLMINFGGSKESEYWSFPLPPISPAVPGMKSSASSVDVRAFKSQVEVLTEDTFGLTVSLLCMQAVHEFFPQMYSRLHCSGTSTFCCPGY